MSQPRIRRSSGRSPSRRAVRPTLPAAIPPRLVAASSLTPLPPMARMRAPARLVAATSSTVCQLLSTPAISVTRVCPTTPVAAGEVFSYSGSVQNTGDVVLTNVVVLSSQPAANTKVLGPIDLAPGESEHFTGSYTVAAGSDPALDTVAVKRRPTSARRGPFTPMPIAQDRSQCLPLTRPSSSTDGSRSHGRHSQE